MLFKEGCLALVKSVSESIAAPLLIYCGVSLAA